jgi:predicted PurR-regulated permease PerM
MRDTFLSKTFMVCVIFVIIIAGLIVGRQIAIPLALALFLSLGLSPLAEWFQRKKLPRIPSIILTFVMSLAIISLIGSVIGIAIADFAGKVPDYYGQADSNVSEVKTALMERFGLDEKEITQYTKSINFSTVGVTVASNIVNTTTSAVGILGLTLVMTFLLMLYRDRVRKFFTLIANEHNQKSLQVIVRKSFNVLPKYLTGILIVICIMAVLNSVGFWLIGVPSPLFWGIMVSFLNVIPYVGTIIGFGAVALFTLIVVSPSAALFAIIMFLIIQFIDNNFLTPLIAGGQIDINPLAAIISIIVWGMIWGVLGMILALPILGLIKIVCDSVPELEPYGYLLGNTK